MNLSASPFIKMLLQLKISLLSDKLLLGQRIMLTKTQLIIKPFNLL